MRKVPQIIIFAFFCAFILYLPAYFKAANVYASAQDDLKQQIAAKQQEIQQLEKEIQQYQSGIDQSESKAQSLKNEITRLNLQIKQLSSQISLTQKQISTKELQIEDLGLNIDDTQYAMSIHRVSLANDILSLKSLEDQSMLEVFLKYNSIAAFFNELEKTKTLGEVIRQNYNELAVLEKKLENNKNAALKAKQDLSNLKSQLTSQKTIQEDNKSEKSSLLVTTKNQESAYQKLLRDREAKRAQIYQEISKIEAELEKQVDLGSLPSFGHGVLLFPIDGGVLTQGFGYTSFSKTTDVYGNNFHNGVDFRATIGTPVHAAFDGVIKAIGNSDLMCPKGSYGKWILVEHPNKLATLYAHLSLISVSGGQKVLRGDIIGYSGSTGYVTGPHLHFTVYDARTVQLRQSRVCGVLPYGGYLDPMSYL